MNANTRQRTVDPFIESRLQTPKDAIGSVSIAIRSSAKVIGDRETRADPSPLASAREGVWADVACQYLYARGVPGFAAAPPRVGPQ